MTLLHFTELGEISAHADTRVEARYACRGTTSDMEEAIRDSATSRTVLQLTTNRTAVDFIPLCSRTQVD